MIIYKNTFENIKTVNYDFPIEDSYYAKGNLGVVADGITRDSIGIKNLNSVSFEERIMKYPNPSGASIASDIVCKIYEKNYDNIIKGNRSLKKVLIEANKQIKSLNKKYIKKCDYLENDFYGTVAASAFIKNNILCYCYICDCGVAVFDKQGKLKFKTNDDMKAVEENFDTGKFTWNEEEARVIVRKKYRNNPNNIYSYGALTGEVAAKKYIKTGFFTLDDDDIVIVYTDGFTNYLYENEFYNNLCELINGNKISFENYLETMGNKDYKKYGKEKTMVVMKNEKSS